MAVGGVGNNINIDWSILLNNISGTQQTGGTEGTQGTQNLVLSEKDKEILLNMLSSPELEGPDGSNDPAAKLESLLSKLQDGKTFDFTPEQLKTYTDTVKTLLNKVNTLVQSLQASAAEESSTPGKTDSAKVFFDIYSMMALIAECAQEMKNAQREQRQAENQAIVTSIQNQADAQRTAALTGLIAGTIICAIQLGASVYSAAKTISNTATEAKIANEFKVPQAAKELGQAETEFKTAQTELKTYQDAHADAPADDPELVELQTKVNDANQNLMEKRTAFKAAKTNMEHSPEYAKLQQSQAWTRAITDISQAFGNFGQTFVRGIVDLKQAEATEYGADQKKAEDALEQTKDLMASFQELIDQVSQLAQAVLSAENDSMRDAIQA